VETLVLGVDYAWDVLRASGREEVEEAAPFLQ